MAAYALIVAVQKYPNAAGLAGDLPGTNDAAKTFCKWLIEKKAVFPKGHPQYDPKRFFCCGGEELDFRTHGTTRSDIVQALQDLERAAKDNADELYCYFAGHGFCYPCDEIVQEDIFVASDFESLKKSGNACLKLKEVMELLTSALGPCDQYYFFDACRTEVKFGEVRPTDTGITFDRSQLGYGGKAVLFSIEQGLAARTDSRFSEHLVNGLYGNGRAKGWYNESLYVKFEFLWNYVQSKMNKKVSHSIGESEGLILKIDPIPKQQCRVRVSNADPDDKFTYRVKRRKTVIAQGEFNGVEHVIDIDEPGEYFIELDHASSELVPVVPPPNEPVDLYDPAEVHFRKSIRTVGTTRGGSKSIKDQLLESKPREDQGTILIQGAPTASIRLESTRGDFFLDDHRESMKAVVAPGEYQVILEERGEIVARRKATVSAGEKTEVDMLPNPPTLHSAILAHVAPNATREIYFSESLGAPTVDRDLGLWLTFLGASRIVAQHGQFSKLSAVPLAARFDNIRPGGSAIYVVAGFEGQVRPYAVGVGKKPKWKEMAPVQGIAGLFEFWCEIDEGPTLLSFQAEGRAPYTVATNALPNHATLIPLTSGLTPIQLYQLLLPIWNLTEHLAHEVPEQVHLSPLKTIRFIAHLERLFSQDHSLNKAFGEEAASRDPESKSFYKALISSEWLDPIGSLFVAHDLLRRGVLNPKSKLAKIRPDLSVTIGKLRQFFGTIPDVEALAKANGQTWSLPATAPLLADSLTWFSLDEQRKFMPYPHELRYFGTPWVSWINAVEPYFSN